MTFDDFQHGVREMPFVGKVSWAIGRMVPTTGSVFMRLWYNFLLPYYEWVAVGQSQPSKNVSKTLRCVDWVILHVLFFSNFPFLPYFLLLCIFCWTSCPYECMMKLIFQPLTFYICIPYSIISYYLREDSGMKLHILPFFFYHPLIDKLLISRNFLEWHLYSIASNP